MKIAVCVKVTAGELSPFDCSALEEALRVPNAQVTVLSMGPRNTRPVLEELIQRGAPRVVLLSDPAFAGADTLATGYTLVLALKKLEPDLVLCGRQSMDGDTAQTGPGIAAALGWDCLPYVLKMEVSDGEIRAQTRLGERRAALPAVATLERTRVLRFPGIRRKQGVFEIWDAAAIGADPARCGLNGSPTRVLRSWESARGRRKCRMIRPGELPALLQEQLERDFSPAKPTIPEKRLSEVWVVGDELREAGEAIAERVAVLPREEPEKLVRRIAWGKPGAVLWPSDWWGRSAAPKAAVLLQTGLCADCTALETDGEELYFYRPAFGGGMMAKIRCRTLPRMGTVRLSGQSGDRLLFAMGMGVRGQEKAFRTAAGLWGAGLAASRPAVDAGLAPYEEQVGLTGRMVRPKVYLAVGISGAVQHTCAIEGAGCVIAVNPDPGARIFQYADFGVTCTAETAVEILAGSCGEKR